MMTILEQMNRFSDKFGKTINVSHTTWHYYRLGMGKPILWLTGGLRRAALGFTFGEAYVKPYDHCPRLLTGEVIDEFSTAFDVILKADVMPLCPEVSPTADAGTGISGTQSVSREKLILPAPVRQIMVSPCSSWIMPLLHWHALRSNC
jgi:hypothetical protein